MGIDKKVACFVYGGQFTKAAMRLGQKNLRRIGPLEALELGSPTAEFSVVLLHGYGADAYDLSPMAEELDLGPKVKFVFLQGPLTVPIGPMMSGRAWFPIDMSAHEQAALSGQPVDYSRVRPQGADQARDRVVASLAELKTPLERIVLGGFSQGTMLSVDVAMALPGAIRGVALLSGVLADEATVRSQATKRKGLKYFQSHGKMDPILPFSGAERLHLALEEAGWDGFLHEFRGGHEIPADVILNLRSFLRSVFDV